MGWGLELEIGNWILEVGNWKIRLKIGIIGSGEELEIGNRELEIEKVSIGVWNWNSGSAAWVSYKYFRRFGPPPSL